MVDTATKEKFIELRAAGMSFDSIAEQLNISKPTLLKMSRELSGDIERLKFINLEALAEKHKVLKTARLDTLGKLLEKVDSALDSADFTKVGPERLIDLKFKLTEKLQAEFAEPFSIQRSTVSELLDRETDYTLKID